MDAAPRLPALSLVIPAYNEAAGIDRAVAEADDVLATCFERYEVLVIDDGSADGTAEKVADAAAGRPNVRLIRHARNRGYGAALRTGFEAARYDSVAFTDADRQFDLRDLVKLTLATEMVPLAVGIRVDRQDPWRRRMLSKGYNVLARAWLGTRVRDCDCALKVFRREALVHLMPTSHGFFVNTEMLSTAARLGFGVVELPVTHRPRLHGTSSVSLREVPRMLRTMARFWWQSRRAAVTPSVVVATRLSVPEGIRPAPARRPGSAPGSLVARPVPLRVSA